MEANMWTAPFARFLLAGVLILTLSFVAEAGLFQKDPDFSINPHLCVFEGVGSRIFPKLNVCPLSVGRDFKLDETIKLAVNAKNAVCMWGPYEISKEGFELGVKRLRLLDGGTIRYRADDRLYRKDRIAINCFHAMSGLAELYPNGGIFGTGFKMWGINGTARVLIE